MKDPTNSSKRRDVCSKEATREEELSFGLSLSPPGSFDDGETVGGRLWSPPPVVSKLTLTKGHELDGPKSGLKYKQEHSSLDPSGNVTETRSSVRAQATFEASFMRALLT